MEKTLRKAFGHAILSIVLLCATGTGARGADSLCIQFIGSAGGAPVELKAGRTLAGMLPVTLCDLDANGRYRMTVGGGLVERRVGTLKLGGHGAAAVGGLRVGSALRNVVLPGWGSAFSGRGAVGLSDGLSIAAAVYLFVQENQEYRHLKNRSDNLDGALSRATSASERERAQAAAHDARREVNVQNRHCERLALVAAGLYAYQVLDPWLSSLPPRCTIEGAGTIVRLDESGVSRAKAFVHSLVRPGSGQFYEGKRTRGFLFSVATTAAGLAALEYHNRYDEVAGRYEACVERFNASDNIAEKERLIDEASNLWDDVEQQKEYRTGAYAVLAGVWAWNLVDALFPGGNGDGRAGYSLNLEAEGLALVFRF
jgi:hypothetical protein